LDCAVAGGNDLLSTISYYGFNGLALLSRDGCRPLDVARDGMSLGDGAGYVVLERASDAVARGAPVLGYVVGYACASEGHHPTAPDPEGSCPIRVMAAALGADRAPHELALVSTHGTGTPANDEVEVRAIQAVAKRFSLPGPVDVVSLKSRLGHTLGAAGALELVATLACMRAALSPGTAGLQTPVPHRSPLRLERAPRSFEAPIPLALCNAFGFGGSVASVALRVAPGRP
jgi:3-oxoacyl-[acyl-carrier-protein] synthase II